MNLDYSITLAISERRDLECELDRAVELAMQRALQSDPKRGVLVTRHDHRNFTIELADEVPFGVTFERDRRSN